MKEAANLEVLITREQIEETIAGLAEQIGSDYRQRDLTVVGVMKGALFFIADLLRHLDMPVCLEIVQVASYEGTESSGEMREICWLGDDIRDRDVLVVDDVLDTGRTLSYILRRLEGQRPRSLKTCALLEKRAERDVDVILDYRGFEIGDEFVVGYGLDYNGHFRHLPYIAVLRVL